MQRQVLHLANILVHWTYLYHCNMISVLLSYTSDPTIYSVWYFYVQNWDQYDIYQARILYFALRKIIVNWLFLKKKKLSYWASYMYTRMIFMLKVRYFNFTSNVIQCNPNVYRTLNVWKTSIICMLQKNLKERKFYNTFSCRCFDLRNTGNKNILVHLMESKMNMKPIKGYIKELCVAQH